MSIGLCKDFTPLLKITHAKKFIYSSSYPCV